MRDPTDFSIRSRIHTNSVAVEMIQTLERTMIQEVLNDIDVDTKAPCNINYAKARYAINDNLIDENLQHVAKMAVIEFFKGTVRNGSTILKKRMPNFVEFPDGTKARF